MNPPVSFRTVTTDGNARTGTMSTPHGSVATPNFMAVGTRATVKTLDTEDMDRLGAQILLANTYHLMLRPGADIVAELGGLHGFMAWDAPILTDSGGYQVLSLEPKISEDRLVFRSTYDGSQVDLTPERSVAIQEELGADIAMALDVPVNLPASRDVAERAMYQTLRWAERSKDAKTRADRALFGIVQGGADRELRAISARETASIGFPGFGIGGLAVGETAQERKLAIAATVPELPESGVRYVMGLGDTEGMLDAVALGVDLFDCVIPTRVARHGKVLARTGDYSIRRTDFTHDTSPLEAGCDCITCRRYSRAYLRHLRLTKEMTADRLLTIHNLAYTYRLMDDARHAIETGSFAAFRADVVGRRRQGVGSIGH